jgi:nucleotide-binding universal stress UspA family protein
VTVLAGFSFGRHDPAPIELGAGLARSAGQDLRVVTVVPAPWGTPAAEDTDREFRAWAEGVGRETVVVAERLVAEHAPDLTVSVGAVAARSVPGGLLDEANRCEARLLVVGSGHGGGYGRIQLSSAADRLLHSAHVPVALATRGYLASEHGRVTRATCAFRGDEVSRRTLQETARICRDVGAALRIVTFAVRGRTMYPPDVSPHTEDDVLGSWVRQAEALQQQAVAELSAADGLPDQVTSEVAVGRSWAATLDRLAWDRDEVLVIGSSSAGVVQRLFLGSSGAKILRHAPVPVIVVP